MCNLKNVLYEEWTMREHKNRKNTLKRPSQPLAIRFVSLFPCDNRNQQLVEKQNRSVSYDRLRYDWAFKMRMSRTRTTPQKKRKEYTTTKIWHKSFFKIYSNSTIDFIEIYLKMILEERAFTHRKPWKYTLNSLGVSLPTYFTAISNFGIWTIWV